MTPVEKVSGWREEIAIEIQEAEGKLTSARAALETAEIAHSAARAQWQALDCFMAAPLRDAESLCGPLHGRLMRERDSLQATESARGAARATVKSLEDCIKRLRESLAQADRMVTAAKVATLPSPTVAPRPKPVPVEFDTIVQSREAV